MRGVRVDRIGDRIHYRCMTGVMIDAEILEQTTAPRPPGWPQKGLCAFCNQHATTPLFADGAGPVFTCVFCVRTPAAQLTAVHLLHPRNEDDPELRALRTLAHLDPRAVHRVILLYGKRHGILPPCIVVLDDPE